MNLIFILFVIDVTIAQSCLPEGIAFSRQTQIDSFSINYPNCKAIEGFVQITGDDIFSLDSLYMIKTIGRYLDIRYNSINSLSGLKSLDSVGEGLNIVGNYELINLTGVENLTHIGGVLWISSNYGLIDLSGLESLTSIEGTLYILENHSLLNIKALKNLTTINGDLNISSNYVLENLTGLDNIAAGTMHNIMIYNNSNLSYCNVKSICDYLASPNGVVSIGPNSTGCNSQEEVEEGCAVLCIERIANKSPLNIYPSPAKENIIIETKNKGIICIISFDGKKVLSQNISMPKSEIDVSHLQIGIYTIMITGESSVESGKFIKQ